MNARTLVVLAAAAAAAMLGGGCGGSLPAASRNLGAVDSSSAFAAARDVMSQYFTLDQEDPDLGRITTQPKLLQQRPDKLLTTSGRARQKAALRLVREGKDLVAYLTITVERQESAPARRLEMSRENYSSVPDQTPAETGAAATAEQNEVWTLQTYDAALANTILQDLSDRLRTTTTQPGNSTE